MPLKDIINDERKNIKEKTQEAIEKLFPIEGRKNKLNLDDIEIKEDVDSKDVKAQLEAKDNEDTFAEKVYGTMELRDKESDEVIDRKKKKIADLPSLTERGTFIVNGTEYSVPTLMKLKPGVYTKTKKSGEITSQFNLERGSGRNFNLTLKPGKDVFKFETSWPKKTLDAYPVLKAIGVSDKKLKESWGEKILNRNKEKADKERSLNGLYEALEGEEPPSLNEAKDYIAENITEGNIDSDVTKKTLGEEFDSPEPESLVKSTEKILGVARGEKDADDRDSIMFKEPNRVSDSLKNRLEKNEIDYKVRRKVKNNLDRKDDLNDIFRTGIVNDQVEKFFTNSQLATVPEQTNPMEFIKNTNKITVLGEGGLQETKNVPDEAREVSTAQMGFVDPVVTPESDKTGLVEHIAEGARIDGKKMKTRVVNRNTGEQEVVEPDVLFESTVSFPDQFENKNPHGDPKREQVKAMGDGKMKQVDPDEVDYVFPDGKSIFSMSALSVPFLPTDQGNRTQMATKMSNQSVPLSEPEAPLVQNDYDGERTVEEEIGRNIATTADKSGEVVDVDKENQRITVKTDDGEKYVKSFYKNFPLNRESFLDSTVKVSEGDSVEKGDVLADMNFTDDGELALGKNLKTAYIPYRGLNFEDGVVISEQASDKLRSDRLKTFEVPKDKKTRLGKNNFESHFPGEVKREKWQKMDEDLGIVQEGEEIEEGEPVAAFLKEREVSPEEAALGQFHRVLEEPWKKEIKKWDEPSKGEVKKVVEKPDKYEVRVKTESPMRIGDKIANRHGNKGVISKVLPDSEMPQDENDDPIDVLFNPHGVVSRINAGQVFENAAGKLADQKGEKYISKNFDGPENVKEKLQSELEEEGITDKERVFDPKHGEVGKEGEKDVNVGKQYIMKLDHRAKDKYSARAYDDPYSIDLTPVSGKKVGGQNIGPLVFNSLLSQGARKNLHEMTTYKTTRNPEFWRAVETDDALPSPEPSEPWRRFANTLSGAGINVRKTGDKLKLTPFTDETVENISKGEIKNPREVQAKGKELKPEEGGLFDPDVTGGLRGERWGHIELPEEIPQPIFEKPIKELTDLSDDEYRRVLRGEASVDKDGTLYDRKANEEKIGSVQQRKKVDRPEEYGETGGQGIKNLFNNMDLGSMKENLKEEAKTQTGSDLNKSHRKLRYIDALDELDESPDAYFSSKLPVVPPKFRPIIPTENGKLIKSGLTKAYKDVIEQKRELERADENGMPEKQKGSMRETLYDKMKGLAGIADNSRQEERDYQGAIEEVAGDTPKSGYFQGSVLSQRQEQSGRAVAVPDPDLNVDEIGIPKKMGFRMLRPKIVRKLHRSGYSPLEAKEKVDEEDQQAEQALKSVAQDEVLLMNRAPSLHKFSIQAFTPKIQDSGDDYTVNVPGLIHKGFNMDHDGDSNIEYCYILKNEEAERIHISNFPHGDHLRTEDNTEFYDVPDDVEVFGYDDNHSIRPFSVEEFSIHHDLRMLDVEYESGRTTEVSDDHSLFSINPETLSIDKSKPEESIGHYCPRPKKLTLPSPKEEIEWPDYDSEGHNMKSGLTLDKNSGYFWGCMVGDGYTTKNEERNHYQIGFCNSTSEIKNKFNKQMKKYGGNIPDSIGNNHTFNGRDCYSEKTHYSFDKLGHAIQHFVDQGSENKTLPSFWTYGNKSFRRGLLSGLIDTDGTIAVTYGKDKPQVKIQYATSSETLAEEVMLLCNSLGIRANKTNHTDRDKDEYTVMVSSVDFQEHTGDLCIQHPDNKEALEYLEDNPANNTHQGSDPVPIPTTLAVALRKSLGHPRDCTDAHHTAYVQLQQSKDKNRVNRHTYKKWKRNGLWSKMIEDVPDELNSLLEKFVEIAEADDIVWDKIVDMEVTGTDKTAYDITVPECNVFMASNGIILFDSVALHTPITDEAKQEAKDMLPSKNLFNPANNELIQEISHEGLTGLSLMTEDE